MDQDFPPKPETQSLPFKIRFKLWLNSIVTNIAMRPDGTLNRFLPDLFESKTPANSTPINGVNSYDVSIDPNRNLSFRVFVPVKITDKLPVLIYFHGGGYAFDSADSKSYDEFCRRFAGLIPAIVVSGNYPLTPEHRYPAQFDNGIDILKFLDDDENRNQLPENADLRRCFVSGDSAGGNLAHNVCIIASQHKFQQIKVIGLVALQPAFGGEKRTTSELLPENSIGLALKQTDFYWNAFKPLHSSWEEWNRDNGVINVSGPRAVDISELDFPATLVVVGGRDILQDWQWKYYEWLKMGGKEVYLEEYQYMFHAFMAFTELAETSHLMYVVSDFVTKQMKRHAD